MHEEEIAEKTCVPCQGGVPRLSLEQAQEMLGMLDNWCLNEDATCIIKTFSFKNFESAQDFACHVGELAEREFHHPDISYGWGYCKVLFQTHKIRGLHENDFIMAAKLDRISINHRLSID